MFCSGFAAGDSNRVSNQMKDLEARTAAILEEVKMVKGTIVRTLTAWESYCDTYSSLHAWLEQETQTNRHGQRPEVSQTIFTCVKILLRFRLLVSFNHPR